MIIGFIGCPCSGKTTTAAMVFADLKTMGLPTEFIPEQARLFIAKKRIESGLGPRDPIQLTGFDQLCIMEQQLDYETTLAQACGPDVIIVADSSVLNTLLYMTPEMRSEAVVQEMVKEALGRYDLLFYCAPVRRSILPDPNRVHSEEQSLAIDRMIPDLLREVAPDLQPVLLYGEPAQRHHQVTRAVLERSLSC